LTKLSGLKPGKVTEEREDQRGERRVIISASEDPFWNLAVEEYLLDTLPDATCILLLYKNGPSVIIGKHQNPWLEANLPELISRNVVLLRRISGGGTVYHDGGNLNFSFLSSKDGFDRRENLELVSEVLRSFGINATITDTHDLYVGEKKISGNAFCFRRNHVVHHGTLLVSADLARLSGLLTHRELPIVTHAVRSNPAATVNLGSLENGITTQVLISGMTAAFLEGQRTAENISPENFQPDEVARLTDRNRTWEWNYGRTPDFKLELSGLTVSIRKGLITAIEGSDRLESLIGIPFRKTDLDPILEAASDSETEAAISALYSLSL
jgi:lipoate---protein ligase